MIIKELLKDYHNVCLIDIAYYDGTQIDNLEELSFLDYYQYANYGTIGKKPNEDELKMEVIKHHVISHKLAKEKFSHQIPKSELSHCLEMKDVLVILAKSVV